MDRRLTRLAFLAAVLALLTLAFGTGCVFRDDDTDRVGPAKHPPGKPEAAAPAQPQRLGVAKLVTAFRDGDSGPVVLSWFTHEEPLVEAYSFLEYPEDYAIGRAYYWGDWQTRADNYCAVRMQKNYIPVSLDLTLGWYSAVTGFSVEKLREQFMVVYNVNQGTLEEITGKDGSRVGDRYSFVLDGIDVELLTRDAMSEDLVILAMKYSTEHLEKVMAAKERYPEFREAGATDRDATLAELVTVLAEERARGVLDQFDYSGFKHHQVYAPPHDPDKVDYREATFYQSGDLFWSAVDMCTVGIYDDGARTLLLFTPAWYADHCGHSAEDLAAEFDGLLAAHGGRRLAVDTELDDYDVEFEYCYTGEVNVIRRNYTSYRDGGHSIYFLQSGPELFPDAAGHVPAWTPEDLPVEDDPGPLARFIHGLATTGMNELRGRYFFNGHSTTLYTKLFEPQLFTTRQRLDVLDYSKHRQLAQVYIMDQTYFEEVRFTPVWFEELLGTPAVELGADFASLLAAAGGNQAPAGAEDFTQSFQYGPLTISLDPGGVADEGYDTWYRIEFPTWP